METSASLPVAVSPKEPASAPTLSKKQPLKEENKAAVFLKDNQSTINPWSIGENPKKSTSLPTSLPEASQGTINPWLVP